MDQATAFSSVIEVIRTLLSPEGCPWDRKQTPESLCDYVIEEAFELTEAIRAGDAPACAEEIGDVMFLLFFLAELFARRGNFTLTDVLEANAAKMIRRHPHVFADVTLADQDELLRNWERIKREEKTAGDTAPRLFDSLPRGLPPLLKAYRIHSKAARTGFTWPSDDAARTQLAAEKQELDEAVASGDQDRVTEEFGDYLFTLVEIGRRLGVKANAALEAANLKFLARYRLMEDLARGRGLSLPDLSLEEQNALWDEAKGRA
jgi:ATP diphosphatase